MIYIDECKNEWCSRGISENQSVQKSNRKYTINTVRFGVGNQMVMRQY